MTLFLAIFLEAIVKAIVSASGNPSGIADTAKAITDSNISLKGSPLNTNNIAIIKAIIIINKLICLENSSTLIVKGDFSSFVSFMVLAILPISVFKLVPTTIPMALPVITLVPANNILFCSLIVSSVFESTLEFFSIGKLSPVKVDSFIVKLLEERILISAEILSPDVSKIISPMVIPVVSINSSLPDLITLTFSLIKLDRASAVLLAVFS